MLQFLAENTTLTIAVIVFMICVIIGFFGDIYLRKHNKIENIFNFSKKVKKAPDTKKDSEEHNENLVFSSQSNISEINNGMNQEIAGAISPDDEDLSKAIAASLDKNMPSENKPVDMLGQEPYFTNGSSRDDEINNMF